MRHLAFARELEKIAAAQSTGRTAREFLAGVPLEPAHKALYNKLGWPGLAALGGVGVLGTVGAVAMQKRASNNETSGFLHQHAQQAMFDLADVETNRSTWQKFKQHVPFTRDRRELLAARAKAQRSQTWLRRDLSRNQAGLLQHLDAHPNDRAAVQQLQESTRFQIADPVRGRNNLVDVIPRPAVPTGGQSVLHSRLRLGAGVAGVGALGYGYYRYRQAGQQAGGYY